MSQESSEKAGLSRVILGTAQFGLDYGVSNTGRRPNPQVAHSILDVAQLAKIRTLDTAQAYGESERVIGQYSNSQFAIQTKVGSPPAIESDWSNWLLSSVLKSEQKLNSHILRTVFFHDTTDLVMSASSVARSNLEKFLRSRPSIELGASLYDPDEWAQLKLIDEISVYQVPYNIFDRRFEDSGIIQEMIDMGKVVQARSIFLQGLLLMKPEKVPLYFEPWIPALREFHDFCSLSSTKPLGVAANFALENSKFHGVVVGFDDAKQISELLDETSGSRESRKIYPSFGNVDLGLLDPRRWGN